MRCSPIAAPARFYASCPQAPCPARWLRASRRRWRWPAGSGRCRRAGFKVGATAAGVQAYLGLDGPVEPALGSTPVAGFMAEGGLHGAGSALSFAAFLNPGVECELAVYLSRDLLPGPCTPEQAEATVGGVMAAIEIVEKRYWDLRVLGAPALVADQAFHAGAVLGAPRADWAGLNLAGLRGEMQVDGAVVGEGVGADLLGHRAVRAMPGGRWRGSPRRRSRRRSAGCARGRSCCSAASRRRFGWSGPARWRSTSHRSTRWTFP